MPRRKRTTPQNEGQRKVRRADDNQDEDTLVISDSENEQEENAVVKMSPREARRRERGSRSQMQDMTEEEMLDLAMRLSKQEASSAAQRQQLEDDDMRKAIAESLHVSQSEALDVTSEPASSTTKPSQDPVTVTTHLRRKLSFPYKTEMTKASDDEVTSAAESGEHSVQDIKPLLPMPDLSQQTLSQPSLPSPCLPPVPSTTSQECYCTQWKDPDEQVLKTESLEDEPSQSDSQAQGSPIFLQQCSVRLNQDAVITSRASWNPLSVQDSSLSLTCLDSSQLTHQQNPSPYKSPVFAKTDPKGSIELTKDEVSCTLKDNFVGKVCTPKEEDSEKAKESSSHKKQLHESRDPRKRLSLYIKSQPSPHTSVPDDGVGPEQETVQPKQLKDDCHRASSNAVLERFPNSEKMPLHVESQSLGEFTSHMVLHLSDDDEEEEEEKVVDPSPVFHQEHVLRPGHSRLSPTQPCCSPPTVATAQSCSCTHEHSTQSSDSQHVCVRRKFTSKTTCPAEPDQLEVGFLKKPACDSRHAHLTDGKGDGLVSYYWGVPFCPRGQSPDDYTRVILSQLEVYEKSLKEAQRQLLHKAEWSLPLFPCPAERPFGRRMKRHRAPQLLEEEEDEESEKVMEEKKRELVEEEKKKELDEEADEDRAESRGDSEKEVEHGQSETYVVVSSPETQVELVQNSPLLIGQNGSSNAIKPSSCTKSGPQDLSDDTQIQQPDEHEDIQNENYDEENTVCPETQMTEDNTPELMVTSPAQPQSWAESEVMEVDEGEAAEEERMEQEQAEEEEQQQQQQNESAPAQSQKVECPMCSRLFPISKIEVHAAYCDGNTEDQEQQDDLSQMLTLRKRTRRIPTEETLSGSEKSEQREKCYLCQRFFPSKQYSHHVEKCLQQKGPRNNQGNGLLSALHQAERVHLDDDDGAGPSDITNKNHGGLADSSEVAEAGGNGNCPASGFHVSSSPIKSFTSISEATDCLIDFQQQYSAKSSQRLGRKRKFKR
ncbi:BRCA1-A complex subunit RAP80 isoform X3 [Pygocentrus nattereri]|uniref:BRCA1-A complex subunit RAP80 isoform X3 n=2 Tax=Pygocentrus nattereri TaxID=42514 RepID=UPI0008144A37|nr:BRCA1-A complex subunit RAP80 isoform X3 [Pygocentrus nattereri]